MCGRFALFSYMRQLMEEFGIEEHDAEEPGERFNVAHTTDLLSTFPFILILHKSSACTYRAALSLYDCSVISKITQEYVTTNYRVAIGWK